MGVVDHFAVQTRPDAQDLLRRKLDVDVDLLVVGPQKLRGERDRVAVGVGDLGRVSVLVKHVEADSPAALRGLLDRFKDKLRSGVMVLGSVSDGKVMLIAGVTPDLTMRFHAGNLIKQVSAVVGGSGGGRPDMAQAGGTQPENLDAALAKALEMIRRA